MVYLLKMVDLSITPPFITDFPGGFSQPWMTSRGAPGQADFACDVGFVRQVGSTECVFGGADMMPERPALAVTVTGGRS